ncbi:hypothetical protein LXA43DRAFT_1060920 [Ganoderma leucocontextum]|nr:hypothetical protein LXA43DRAFT_1060920 [Ganoderma leucocontextum]
MSTQSSKNLKDNFRSLLVMLIAPEPASAAERFLWDQQRHAEMNINDPKILAMGEISKEDVTYPFGSESVIDDGSNNDADIGESTNTGYTESKSDCTYDTESEVITPTSEAPIHNFARWQMGDDKDADEEGYKTDDPNRAPVMRASLRAQGYHWPISIVLPGDGEEASDFPVIVDTGSDYLWVYGEDYVKLEDGDRRSRWSDYDLESLVHHSVLCNTDFNGLESLEKNWNPSGPLIPYGYLDEGLYSDWDVRFGVAFAVNKQLSRDKASGILGLGANNCMLSEFYFPPGQSRYGPRDFPDSNELKPTVGGSTDQFIMYITIRLPAEYYHSMIDEVTMRYPVQSWIAFNRWPVNTMIPMWSKRIALVPPINGGRDRWLVTLKHFTVQRCTTNQRPDLQAQRVGDHDIQWRNGYHLLLDSDLPIGSSTSRIDESVLEYIQRDIFRQTAPLRKDTEHRRFSYDVPKDFNFEDYQVRLIFEGIRGDPVAVYMPFHPFIVTKNLAMSEADKAVHAEGVFLRSQHSGGGKLGLSAFVSFHWGKDGVKSIHMAPQFFEDFMEYTIDMSDD